MTIPINIVIESYREKDECPLIRLLYKCKRVIRFSIDLRVEFWALLFGFDLRVLSSLILITFLFELIQKRPEEFDSCNNRKII